MFGNFKCSQCRYFENRGSYCWCQFFHREVLPDDERDCCVES